MIVVTYPEEVFWRYILRDRNVQRRVVLVQRVSNAPPQRVVQVGRVTKVGAVRLVPLQLVDL